MTLIKFLENSKNVKTSLMSLYSKEFDMDLHRFFDMTVGKSLKNFPMLSILAKIYNIEEDFYLDYFILYSLGLILNFDSNLSSMDIAHISIDNYYLSGSYRVSIYASCYFKVDILFSYDSIKMYFDRYNKNSEDIHFEISLPEDLEIVKICGNNKRLIDYKGEKVLAETPRSLNNKIFKITKIVNAISMIDKDVIASKIHNSDIYHLVDEDNNLAIYKNGEFVKKIQDISEWRENE